MKKIVAGLLFISFCVFFWYMFVKEYDYEFRTSARGTPGAVFSEISEWKQFTSANSYNDIELISRHPFEVITQRVAIDASEYIELKWDLQQAEDSSTALKVSVKSTKDQLGNRWAIVNPFSRSIFLDTVQQKLQAFHQKLKNQEGSYDVRIEGEVVTSPYLACVCATSTKVHITEKAGAMVNSVELLENYVLDRDLELKGYPFVKITEWDREKDLIDFDFCFPINIDVADDRAKSSRLSLKEFHSQPSLKAIFNGNYRLSHIAWFEMLYQAEQKGLSVEALPLEVFHNNPKTELDPRHWTAEIYFPLQQ